jgi:hypothetical protein
MCVSQPVSATNEISSPFSTEPQRQVVGIESGDSADSIAALQTLADAGRAACVLDWGDGLGAGSAFAEPLKAI